MDRERGRAARRSALIGDARRARGEGQPRAVVLNGVTVDYRLMRVHRRSIGMLIDLSGLTVRAPRWVTLPDIEAALSERAAWILRTLDEWRARRRDVLPRQWRSGAPILYQGSELALAVFPSRRREIVPDLFHVTVRHPKAGEETAVAAFVRHWLRDEALRLLSPEIAGFAARLRRAPPALKLSNARTEWGSCNHRGVIRLNWRLIHLPPALARYVAAHEVAHLIELNHSPRFWALVESLFPGHAAARRELGEWTALLEA